tara:strand:+ start:226 stop:393 length:168 start_codon:yes stop_codon:yes gene_type:complete
MYKSKVKPLTKNQKDRLKLHSKHHSKKHILSMSVDMKKGMSFKQSHSKAQKSVGK